MGGDNDVRHDARQQPLWRRQCQRPYLAGFVIGSEIGIRPVAVRRRCGVGSRAMIVEQRPRSTGGEHPLDCRTPIHHSSLRRMRSRMWSEARHAKAMMVSVGFLSAFEANTAPSVTNRLSTSQVWHHWLVTDVLESDPMMVPPTS